MRRLLWVLPAAIFFLDPNLACDSAPQAQFEYGAAEMRAAVEGNWSFAIAPGDGSAPVQLTVSIAQAATAPPIQGSQARGKGWSFVRAAYACGSRTLVRSAGACLDVSEMPLTVTFVSGSDVFSSAVMTGTFTVYGTVFAAGELDLELGPYEIISEVTSSRGIGASRVGPGGAPGGLTIVTRS